MKDLKNSDRDFGDQAESAERFGQAPDLVEKLLSLAEYGPDIPAGGADEVKKIVRPAWRREVRKRRVRTWVWQGGVAVAATVLVVFGLAAWLPMTNVAPDGPVATALRVVGNLDLEFQGSQRMLVAADSIQPGTWLQSDGRSRAVVRLAGGHQLRMDTETRLMIESERRVHLGRGGIYVDSAEAVGGIEVVTGVDVVRDIGTQFELRRRDRALILRVRDGRVELARGARRYVVPPCAELELAADGDISSREIRPDGPQWDWTLDIAPPFELDGRTVLEVLQWAVSETGQRLMFRDPEVEALASETVVRGPLGGMNPGEVPTVVLPSCGLDAEAVAGTLIVRRRASPEIREP